MLNWWTFCRPQLKCRWTRYELNWRWTEHIPVVLRARPSWFFEFKSATEAITGASVIPCPGQEVETSRASVTKLEVSLVPSWHQLGLDSGKSEPELLAGKAKSSAAVQQQKKDLGLMAVLLTTALTFLLLHLPRQVAAPGRSFLLLARVSYA